jgi:hypothetical protein
MLSELSVVAETRDDVFVSELSQALLKNNVRVLEFIEPKVRRIDGRRVTYKPKTDIEFDSLQDLSKETLKKIGCRLWDDFGGVRHWLFPVDWYDSIPHGRVIVFTDGHKELFEYGVTSTAKEIGGLSFGFVQVER